MDNKERKFLERVNGDLPKTALVARLRQRIFSCSKRDKMEGGSLNNSSQRAKTTRNNNKPIKGISVFLDPRL